MEKFIILENPNFIKVNSLKHVYLRKNHRSFLIKKHCSYFKYNDLLHTLSVYKIPRKKDQVVDFWVPDEIVASEILFWKYLDYVPLI